MVRVNSLHPSPAHQMVAFAVQTKRVWCLLPSHEAALPSAALPNAGRRTQNAERRSQNGGRAASVRGTQTLV